MSMQVKEKNIIVICESVKVGDKITGFNAVTGKPILKPVTFKTAKTVSNAPIVKKQRQKVSTMVLGALKPCAYNRRIYLNAVLTRQQDTPIEFKRVKNHYRGGIVDSFLESKQCEGLFSINNDGYKLARDKLGLVFLHVDLSGQLYHWTVKRGKNELAEISYGFSRRKKTGLDLIKKLNELMPNFENVLNRARNAAKLKFTPLTVTVRPCSMLLMRDLRNWHDTNLLGNLGVSCMFSQSYPDKLALITCRFYRRSGISCAIVKQGDNVIARAFVDKDKNYTRIYHTGTSSNNNITRILRENGFTQNNATYNGGGYARLTRDETEIFAPYLDGNDKRIDIIDNDITAKNGKRFVKFEFNGTEIELKTTNGKVSLSGCSCSQCGDNVDEDEVSYLSNGAPVCQECGSYCEACEETVLADDIVMALRENRGDYHTIYVCDYCADNQRQMAVF